MPTVFELLRRRARTQPADHAFYFVDDEPTSASVITYADLDREARAVAAALAEKGASGQPVLLLCPPGRAFVTSFLGCLYAGAVAVPVQPPGAATWSRSMPRLRAIMADCRARIAVGDTAGCAAAEGELAELEWIVADALPVGAGDHWTRHDVDGDSLALLQYTSGSTGKPKGVMLSQANLLHNAELVQAGFGTSPDAVGVSWLPPYHDMGLIGGILQPLYAGFPTALMAPVTFLRQPLTWLGTIAHFGATMSGGPNFAFDLCVRKSTPQQRASLDLSRWTVAFCGAEPVRAATLDRFAEAFAPAGFRHEAFYPCYGLAEATLIVTGGQPPRRAVSGHISCGRPLGQQRLVVVDPDTGRSRPSGVTGEIWVAGPSVAQGYWRKPIESNRTFRAQLDGHPRQHYLRTGDLGYLDNAGDLVVTGRLKDLIIVRGRNLHPEDLEQAVEQHVGGLRPGGSAAFGLDGAGEERVALACEVLPPTPDENAAAAIIATIRQVVAEAAEVSATTVVLLRAGHLPRTSSGKVQRHACRRALLEGGWHVGASAVLGRWDDPADDAVAQTRVEPDLDTTVTGLVARVLGLPVAAVPTDAPLTRLGLDSLRAIELQGSLQVEHGLAVAPSTLLSGITVAELVALTRQPGPVLPEETGANDSWEAEGQRALWLLQQRDPASTAYQISRAARVRSPLDVDALELALRELVDRHAALRTRLPAHDGQPVPEVVAWSGPVLARHDVAGLAEQALRRRVQADADRPFDLARGPLFRASLYTRNPADHVLLLSLHHTITDFWSLSVLVDELLSGYGAARAGRRVAATGSSYDHVVPTAATPRAMKQRLRFWRDALADAPPALELPTSFPRPRVQSLRGDCHQFRLDRDVLRDLDEFAHNNDLTRFVVLTAALAAVLARYASTDDLVLGAPISGRAGTDHHRLGYFVNPVPLRIRLPAGCSFRELARQVRGSVLDALDHAIAFPRLVEAIRPAHDPARPPLLQVLMVLQQPPAGRPDVGAFAVADEGAKLRLGGLDVSPYRLAERGTAFDLALTVAEVDGGLTGLVNYCADLFEPVAVTRLVGHLTTLLTRALSHPDRSVAALSLLGEEERSALLGLAAGPTVPFADQTTLHALFAQCAATHAQRSAVVFGERGEHTLTYRELHHRAAGLATHLVVAHGIDSGDLVGVFLPRGPDAIVAFWAALASGGVYLPLAPDLPPRRLAWLLGDARPVVLLTHRGLADQLPVDGPPRIYLDEAWPATMAEAEQVGDRGGPDDVAYALYTSGSTGRPKAVLLAHRGACNLAQMEGSFMQITPGSRVIQLASCAYDVHVADIVDAHLHGASLHIPPPAATVPGDALVELLTEQRITFMCVSPSVLAALPDAALPDLTHILCGGEVCSSEIVARWAPGRWFVNGYGPAEATVCATWTRCQPDGRRPSIGHPVPNMRVYVLDDRQEPVPIGIPGEIYIGGVGVGLGYLGRPGLTAARFLPDPFEAAQDPFEAAQGSPSGDGRLYRTGDRARWRPDGTLDFLGRLDDQVQIRGMRVEPGEIEARMRELLGSREVAVVARHGPAGGDELVAYLVAPEPHRSVAELRAMLRAELPAPWVPAAFVQLDALPLNRSGKVDRRALPAPTSADRGVTEQLPPRNDLERIVAEAFAQVLRQATVGVRDHFFDELGGSSLLVPTVTNELRRRLGRDVPVTWLFEHPTVEALARALARPEQDHRADPDPDDQAARRRRALARRPAPPRTVRPDEPAEEGA